MSLRIFHIFFIFSAVFLVFGLGFWGIGDAGFKNTPSLWIGVLSFAGGTLLCGYLFWFLKAMKDLR